MVGAFGYTIGGITDGDNNTQSRIESRTCTYYTREAAS